jgi:hypothetical protein
MKKLLVVLVGSLLCCVSCGSDDCPTCPRPPGASGSPPQLANLACVPDSAPAEGTGSITIDCSMTFSDQDGDLETIVFSYVQGCGQNPGPVYFDVRGQAGLQQGGTILLEGLNAPIVQTTCSAGIYTYRFTAVDSEGSESPTETLKFELL